MKIYVYTLLPISEFVLDEKFQRNASKFAIFYIYKNPKLLFPIFILCYFTFSLFEAFRWNLSSSTSLKIKSSTQQLTCSASEARAVISILWRVVGAMQHPSLMDRKE